MTERSLDPKNWDEARRTFHDAVDRCIDWLEDIRSRPVWRETPDNVRAELAAPLDPDAQSLDRLLGIFEEDILPYATGNLHPRFFGWVHGAGTVAGALGEMLAGFMNSNVAGRDHVAVHVERQVIDWCKSLYGLPKSASGLLTSGTSMANVIALAVARDSKAGTDVRGRGLGDARLTFYASREAHGATAKACALLGLGEGALRRVPVQADFRMDVRELAAMVASDRALGFAPAAVIASAGTVNTGAIDDLGAIAALCRRENLWLHVDAAFGGLAILTPEFREALAPIGQADSIAFDFHKWLQVPYDAGCVLVRDEARHRASFSDRREYLAHDGAALAGGDPWFCEYGPEMSRGFRALKIWFTIRAYGVAALGELVARNCRQARHLGARVGSSRTLELLAPISLNIVCFRYAEAPASSLDALNAGIVAALQQSGIAAPSTTRIDGRLAIRVCLTNHRTTTADLDLLADEVERVGRDLARRAA
jgi:glutamate/tyrosine decarboxylase-like PLP-dependent enzyme